MTLSRNASRHVIEASLIPLALFYGALVFSGKSTALLVALGWSYLAIGRRLVRRRRVPGLLLLGALGLTARTVVAFGTGSLFLYFLQPTLTNVAVAGIFLASLASGTPMVERLASDFCPLPEPIQAPVRRYFHGATVLWAGVQLANAGLTIGLLMSQSVQTYVWARSVSSWVITASAIAISTVWFKQSMRRNGILVVHA
jgi:uncharacterized membrane protein